jgi:hypothetical protein
MNLFKQPSPSLPPDPIKRGNGEGVGEGSVRSIRGKASQGRTKNKKSEGSIRGRGSRDGPRFW